MKFHSFRLILGEVGRSVAGYVGCGVYLDDGFSGTNGATSRRAPRPTAAHSDRGSARVAVRASVTGRQRREPSESRPGRRPRAEATLPEPLAGQRRAGR